MEKNNEDKNYGIYNGMTMLDYNEQMRQNYIENFNKTELTEKTFNSYYNAYKKTFNDDKK